MTAISEYATSLALLGAIFALFLLLEFRAPRRAGQRPDALRLVQGVVLYASGALLNRVVLPLGIVGGALLAREHGWGLLNALDAPLWLTIPVTVLALDATNYVRHWAEHNVPLLWRLHRLHHSDEQIDLSTAFRFHPLEALLASVCHLITTLVLGLPFEGVLIHIVLEAVFDLWEHSNVRTPAALTRIAAILVTPSVHRVHHEIARAPDGSNYGTLFTLWDRAVGTYRAPDADEQTAKYGLHNGADHRIVGLVEMLTDPVRGEEP
ncbi:MAG: sterol desaturase family protein [Pseudomonadota bacterium]